MAAGRRIGKQKVRQMTAVVAGLVALCVLVTACGQSAGSAPGSKPSGGAPAASGPQAGAPSGGPAGGAGQPGGGAGAPSGAPASGGAAGAPPSGGAAGGTAGQASAPVTPPAPVKVKMAFTALSGSFMPVWAAQDAGLFTSNGVDLELSYIGNSPTAMAGLLAGEVDMLVGAPDAGNAAAVDGADVVQVGALLNKIVQAIYAAPAYTDPNSLRGHSVGITRFGALSDSAVRYLLRRWNLEPERDVSLRQIGGFPEMVAALSAGGIESGILAPPHTLRAKDLGFVELGNLWTQPLEYPAIVFTARKQRSAEADEKVRRVLRASAEGVHRTKNDRAAAMKTLETYAQSDDARANDEAYEIYTPLFERDLRLSREAFKIALEELVRNKPQAASFDADALMDARFVEELRGSGLIQRLYGS